MKRRDFFKVAGIGVGVGAVTLVTPKLVDKLETSMCKTWVPRFTAWTPKGLEVDNIMFAINNLIPRTITVFATKEGLARLRAFPLFLDDRRKTFIAAHKIRVIKDLPWALIVTGISK